MKVWQSILSEGFKIEVLSSDRVKVTNIARDKDGQWYDDYISYDPDIRAFIVDTISQEGFNIVETIVYKNIRDYLGY